MEEKMKEIYNELNEQNKEVINLLAKAVQIGQENSKPIKVENK